MGLCETLSTTVALQNQQLANQAKLLKKRKKIKKGKRVQLEGVLVYSTEDVLRIAREIEANTERKRKRSQRQQAALDENLDWMEDPSFEILSSDFDEAPASRRRCARIAQVVV
ncbi:hypothetical protein EV356DRAFT_502816 [Viridothelium virens]|uniref:Uncharacterized protein n=1 Tax=Viridothelium virens TaxID=1048519 RepID=A0A6A6GRI5_VIRVR|nr:hypothetical protein EV356DRAFT_502816 [Viridothelium virens]